MRKPDIIISDIMLGDEISYDLFADNAFSGIPILFITQHPRTDLYQDSLAINTSHFLVKPFHTLSLLAAIDRLTNRALKVSVSDERFLMVYDKYNQRKLLSHREILFFTQKRNYCLIKTEQQQYAIKQSFLKVSEQLSPHFLQVNRACMINKSLPFTLELNKKIVKIDEHRFAVGRIYRDNVYSYLNK